jgi:protein SCO1
VDRGWHALVLVAVVGALAFACTAPAQQGAPSPTGGTEVDRRLPSAVLGLPFTDENGRRVTLGDFDGKTVVLTDFLTLCHEVCPLTSASFGVLQQNARAAGLGDDVQFLEVTVDPSRDTPPRLKAYAEMYGSAPNWDMLTGTPLDLARLWKHFGVGYQKRPLHGSHSVDWWTGKPLTYDMDHTDALIFIDGSGAERYVITGAPNAGSATLPPRLKRTLNHEGRRNLAHPTPQAWTVNQAWTTLRWLIGHD